MKYRSYPIRYNRECYQIHIYCYHICSNLGYMCSTNHRACPLNNSIVPSFVNLSSFNFIYPDGHYGSLYNPDMVVIKDTDFKLYVNFPLNNPTVVPIKSTYPITTRILLSILQNVYSTIYDEEQKTASTITKQVVDPCFCLNQRVQDFIPSEDLETKAEENCEECCICYSPLNTKITLNCNHAFHRSCIEKWITTGQGNNCPLCRTTLRNCVTCSNTRLITSVWKGKVIPPIYRDTMERNDTDGHYNIYSYDFQQLAVEQCIYNPRSKTLQVKINV